VFVTISNFQHSLIFAAEAWISTLQLSLIIATLESEAFHKHVKLSECEKVKNTLAYLDTELVIPLKSLIVQVLGEKDLHLK